MLAALAGRRGVPILGRSSARISRASLPRPHLSLRSYTAMASSTAPPWSEWRLNPPCAIPSRSATLSHHDSLPKLPVPDHNATREKVLNSAKALAKNNEEFENMKKKLDGFLASPLAKELNDALIARSKDPWVSYSSVYPRDLSLLWSF